MNLLKMMNMVWASIGRTWIGPMVQRKQDILLAGDLHRFWGERPGKNGFLMADSLLRNPMVRGAYPEEGRRWLQPVSGSPVDCTGANSAVFDVMDYFLIDAVGLIWTTTGTTTLLVMDFDLHPQLAGGGTAVDKLDTVNGVITAPTQASQTAGQRLYRDLSKWPLRIDPGQSIKAIVTTTVTAGAGVPFVLGYPIAEEFVNDANAVVLADVS